MSASDLNVSDAALYTNAWLCDQQSITSDQVPYRLRLQLVTGCAYTEDEQIVLAGPVKVGYHNYAISNRCDISFTYRVSASDCKTCCLHKFERLY